MQIKTDWAQLKYLYTEHQDTVVVVTMLVMPALVMSGALMWIGYDMAQAKMGPLPAAALSITMVLLSIYSVSEAAPIMPAQALENKLRYRRPVGWAYLILAFVMVAFLYQQLYERWSIEPANVLPWMPQLLAVSGVIGGVLLTSLLISIHRLPHETHARIVESTEMEVYTHRTEATRNRRGKIVTWLVRRSSVSTPLTPKELKALEGIVTQINADVQHIDSSIFTVLTDFQDRITK